MADAQLSDVAPKPARSGVDFENWTLSVATLVVEAMPIVVIVAVIGKIPGNHSETLSAWGVLGLMAVAMFATRWLAQREISNTQRWVLGALLTVVALQIVGRLDLSESLRVWDFGWIGDLSEPDSDAFRKFGRVDHTIDGVLLFFVWFRGVLLGTANVEERGLQGPIAFAAVAFAAGFVGGNDFGIEGTVRLAALTYVMVGLAVIAFRAASRAKVEVTGSFRATSLTFIATLGLVWAAVAIFMLIVLLVIAGIAGTGVAEPVLEVLGDGMGYVFLGIAYLLWPLGWLIDLIVPDNPSEQALELPEFNFDDEGEGLPGEESLEGESSSAGAVLVRVFGAIGLVVVFAILVVALFRRFGARPAAADEERDSLWSEANVLDDLKGAWRNLRNRFRRSAGVGEGDLPVARLYFEVLADAERRGNVRPIARTPLQFATALRSQYRSDVPAEISERFSRLRYGGVDSPHADVARLEEAWLLLKEQP
jgi:hypothetical protein